MQGDSKISSAVNFRELFHNISIDNAETISRRYGEVTRALNLEFRDNDSRTANSMQVGSYGRYTAIKGISDLDMLYIMPKRCWDDYKDGGQYRLLRNTADAILTRYPRTEVYPDTLVVVVQYENFKIEVQPVFEDQEGHFTYPYTRKGGLWRTTKPRPELRATSSVDISKNGNLRRLSKMTRAWKNKHGVQMGGLLIDTLAHNFLQSTRQFDATRYASCGQMIRDFLEYLADQPNQERYAALGSGQHVKVHKRFQRKARKGLELAEHALAAGEEARANERWRKLLGRGFPVAEPLLAEATVLTDGLVQAPNTEEFIEDFFPIDIRYSLKVDCEVSQNGFRSFFMRRDKQTLLNRFIKRQKTLDFQVVDHNIPGDFQIYWKVLNRGAEAISRKMIRGQIRQGNMTKKETSDFKGEHIVGCYAVKNGVVVARDRIRVPIIDESER